MKPTSLSKTQQLLNAFDDPEYRFLLLEPILSYGIALGLILFSIAFFVNQSRLQIGGLITLGLSALAFVPYMSARRLALPRIEQIYRFESSTRGKMFYENTIAWSASTWMYTTLVILGVATIIVGSRRNQLGIGLSVATTIVAILSIQNSVWLHYQDSLAYHPNLKAHQAPITETASQYPSHTRPRETTVSSPTSTTPSRVKQRQTRQVRPIQ